MKEQPKPSASATHDDPSAAQSGRGPTVLATALAVPVHALSILVACAGAYALIATWFHPGATLIALLCFLIAWELRPRLGRGPNDVLPRVRFHDLYALVDQISRELGVRPVDGLVLSPWFEASTHRAGIRRQAFVTLGVPLVTILEPQERVSLIAHEVAHLANGDPRRAAILGTALDTLETWGFILQAFPTDDVVMPDAAAQAAFESAFWGIVRFVPALIVRSYHRLLLGLVLRQSRQAEYRADRLAAEMGGSRSSASALRMSGLEEEFRRAAMGAALEGDPASFFDDFRTRVTSLVMSGTLPEPDAATNIDSTHPSTALRISRLERSHRDPRVSLSTSRSEAIDRSIKPSEERLAVQVIDAYRDRLYHRGQG